MKNYFPVQVNSKSYFSMSRSWQFLEQFFLKAEVLERGDEEIVMFDPSDQLERISKKKKKRGSYRFAVSWWFNHGQNLFPQVYKFRNRVVCFFFLFLATLSGLWHKIEPWSLAVKAQSSIYWITREFPETLIFFNRDMDKFLGVSCNKSKVMIEVLVAPLCLTLCNPMDYSPPGSSVHGDSPGKNTGVGCHSLFQGIFPTQGPNPGFPHYRWILYHLSHQGSPHGIIIN